MVILAEFTLVPLLQVQELAKSSGGSGKLADALFDGGSNGGASIPP